MAIKVEIAPEKWRLTRCIKKVWAHWPVKIVVGILLYIKFPTATIIGFLFWLGWKVRKYFSEKSSAEESIT